MAGRFNADDSPWGADTEISMPEPLRRDLPPLVDFGGFTMTAGGITHNLTEAEVEEMSSPFFGPFPDAAEG